MSAYFFLFCYIIRGRKECVTRCFKAKEEETWIGEITSKLVKMRYYGAHRTRILQFKRSSLMTTITFFFLCCSRTLMYITSSFCYFYIPFALDAFTLYYFSITRFPGFSSLRLNFHKDYETCFLFVLIKFVEFSYLVRNGLVEIEY